MVIIANKNNAPEKALSYLFSNLTENENCICGGTTISKVPVDSQHDVADYT